MMNEMFNQKSLTVGLFTGALLLSSSGVLAATTPVNPPRYANEDGHGEILGTVYGDGSAFTQSGDDYSQGGVTATRVDDADDQLFTFETFNATTRAVFATFDQTFGVIPGETSTDPEADFVSLFDVTVNDGDFYDVDTQSISNYSPDETPFRFARSGGKGLLASSLFSDNADFKDHLVTYRLSGFYDDQEVDTFLLFFEDQQNFDFDFNDLVVEIQATDGAPIAAAPTPTAGIAGIALLGGLALRRRRRLA